VTFIPPVDLDAFSPPPPEAKARARAELGFGPDDLVIGNVSNINPQKDHVNFVRRGITAAPSQGTLRHPRSTHDSRPGVLGRVLAEATSAGLREERDLVVRDPETASPSSRPH
jgi:hypothetical protein